MEYKKSIIIMILAVFIFSIASVCASDVNDTTIASEYNSEIDQTTDDAIGVVEDTDLASGEDNEILGEGEQTFEQLDTTINGNDDNDIYLNGNYTYSSGDDSFKKGIVINRDVNIYGNGAVIDGNNEARIFQINGGNVVFYNITFVKGNAGDGYWDKGGAINGNCKAINCIFKENRANDRGGAMAGGSAVNCNFSGNDAPFGGAMLVCSAMNCIFSGNTADHGGAMYSGSAVNCIFSGNTASTWGGAIEGCSAVNCNFSGNTARKGGAMCYSYKWNCTGQDSDYDNTEDLVLHWDAINFTARYGSAEKLPIQLRNQGDNLVDFINYDAVIYKGGVNVRTYHCLSNEGLSLDLLPGIYTAELIVTYLGIDKPEPKNVTLTITDGTTFLDLNKTINGNENDAITLDMDYAFNSTFDSAFREGIVINRTVTINGNGFTIDAKNQARIFNILADGVTVRNLTFKNANTSVSGGAIYWGGDYGNVSSCSFVNNSAVFFGGAINWGGKNGVVSASIFVNNSANYSGGAINWGSRNGVVSGCSFENNSASNGGGAVRWSSLDGILCNSSFVNNSAPNGGAVFWFIGPGSVCNCSFLNNSAGEGIVYFEKDVGSGLNVNGNIFSANNCSAIAFLKSDPTSNIDSNWYDNDADYAGGPNLPQQNSWLVLNATADLATISYSDTAEVMFALYLYDPVSGNSSLYDSAQFEKIRLSITAIKGNAPSLAKFGEKITFTSTEAGNGGVTATLGRKSLTVNLTINKAQTAFEASPVTAKYGEDKYLTVTLRDDKGNPIAGASVTININGIKTYTTDKNGQIKVKTQGIVPKTYTAKISFGGNANYAQSAKDVKITIKKAKPKLAAKNKKFKKSKKVKKYAVTLKDANKKPIKKAKLTLKIKGKKAITVKTNKKGKATFKIKKLTKKGRYSAKVTFKGDKCYTKLAKKVKITVK